MPLLTIVPCVLLMEKVPLVASVANVIADWPDLWPEFSTSDMENLCAAGALAFDRGSIRAPSSLQERYGTAEFFRHCLVLETPLQAAQMGELPQSRHNPAIVAASDYAKRLVGVFEQFVDEHADRLDVAGRTVVIGHADTKPSNAAIAAKSRDEVVQMVKNPDLLQFVLLDAQSLAVKAAMLHGTEEGGVYYAHWPFVPRVQQVAFSLKSLLGLGLDDMHDNSLDRANGLGIVVGGQRMVRSCRATTETSDAHQRKQRERSFHRWSSRFQRGCIGVEEPRNPVAY